MRADRTWELISGQLGDGADMLVLKMPTGETYCEYAPGRIPHQKYWCSYYNGDPRQDFSSKEACVANAEKIAGHKLVVRPFEYLRKAMP